MIIRFVSDRHPTPVRLWLVDDAFVLAADDVAALVLTDRPLTGDMCADLAAMLTETAEFLKGQTP